MKLLNGVFGLVLLLSNCRPEDPKPPPPAEKPYELQHTAFSFLPNSKVYLDSALHIHASAPAWAPVEIKKGVYDVRVDGWGQQGPFGWPILGLGFDSTSTASGPSIVASVTLDTAIPDSHQVRIQFLSDSLEIYLWLTNDSYEKNAGDTNAHIQKLIFRKVATKIATVSWDPNSESDLAGYRAYSGRSSRLYHAQTDAGLFTSLKIELESGVENFVAVTAYDSAGNESDYSSEVKVIP